eukprot:Polyplicarium_translucidae@DN4960_c0_g1_i1.p1
MQSSLIVAYTHLVLMTRRVRIYPVFERSSHIDKPFGNLVVPLLEVAKVVVSTRQDICMTPPFLAILLGFVREVLLLSWDTDARCAVAPPKLRDPEAVSSRKGSQVTVLSTTTAALATPDEDHDRGRRIGADSAGIPDGHVLFR